MFQGLNVFFLSKFCCVEYEMKVFQKQHYSFTALLQTCKQGIFDWLCNFYWFLIVAQLNLVTN